MALSPDTIMELQLLKFRRTISDANLYHLLILQPIIQITVFELSDHRLTVEFNIKSSNNLS